MLRGFAKASSLASHPEVGVKCVLKVSFAR